MADRYEIRLSGSGGQGLITAGIILAEAIGIHDGRFVCQSQSYGPEARGGLCKSEVIISDEEIDYPEALQPDVLLAMCQEACDTYLFDLKHGGILILDSGLVRQLPTSHAFAIPFTGISRRETGRETAANIVALGALATITRAVSMKGLEAAVLSRVPAGTGELNRKALRAAAKAARRCLKQDRQGAPE